jgi:hypothetical protein
MALYTGEWPDWFKNARMRHLIKSSAHDYTTAILAKHTRPISILPCMAKRAQAMMTARLAYITEAKDEGTALGEKQFGFRPKRGGPDNLLLHIQDVKQGWRKKWFAVEVCRDAVKAFDKVHHPNVLYRLRHKHKVEGPLLRLVASFLQDRSAHTILGEHVGQTLDLNGGTPQGSICSPLLYVVDVDGQATLCDEDKTELLGAKVGTAKVAYYADDARIWILLPGPDAQLQPGEDWKTECKKRLDHFQDVLDESCIRAAMERQRYSDDPKKLQMKAYVPKHWDRTEITGLLKDTPLFLQDKQINMMNENKDLVALGLAIDGGLSFEKHINAKVAMATKRLRVLEHLKSLPWFADNHSMIKRVYIPWVASLWEYASHAWITASPSLLKKIDAVERKALGICLGLKQGLFASRLALLHEAGIHSAQQRRLIAAACYWHKASSSARGTACREQLEEWKSESPDWKAEVEEAKSLCAYFDIQTDEVLASRGVRRANENKDKLRTLVTPLAACAAAAHALQLSLLQTGHMEPYGLATPAQRCKPYNHSNPCDGLTDAAEWLETPITTEALTILPWTTLFPRHKSENCRYYKPVLGSASDRTPSQKDMANAYAAALASALMKRASLHSSNVVCATDGASVSSWAPSVLEDSRSLGKKELGTRHGGGAGAVIAGAFNKMLAVFGTKHGRVSDSASDEMAGMHSLLMALVAAYLGPDAARELDKHGRARALYTEPTDSSSTEFRWETPDGRPPPRL